MRRTDITKITTNDQIKMNEASGVLSTSKNVLKLIWKFIYTSLLVLVVSGSIVVVSLLLYIFSFANEPTGIDLRAAKLRLTSFIYVDDGNGNWTEYSQLHGTENRVWVDYNDIPKNMRNAMVAIEDKRYWDHEGVDWYRTIGAVVNLASGTDNYGGSTITQQLIKNKTNDNDVSLNRKLREIFRALKLEKEFTKDEILESYLNIVNFGGGCRGVQSAANLYFAKDIKDCTVAECAAIAGITQNPSKFDPLIYPENNKIRRDIVIGEMYAQEMISESEYKKALEDSKKMKFVGYTGDSEDIDEEEVSIQNWFVESMFVDLQRDLSAKFNISEEEAAQKLYNEGLKIYCTMDLKMQTEIEKIAKNIDKSNDKELQTAMVMMDFNGRIIASVGSSKNKTGNLVLDRANDSHLQPGSTIKPLFTYPMAIDQNDIYYSSFLKDAPIEDWFKPGEPGPFNWYDGYLGNMILPYAIEKSSNGTAVQVMKNYVGPKNAYDKAVTQLGFKYLDPDEDTYNVGPLSIGGMNGGVTVREMAAAYQYMGNGGRYYEPYTYYYITDNKNNVLIDNRSVIPIQAYSAETATIMNRLLHYNIESELHDTRAYLARINDSERGIKWDIVGKTGSTEYYKDCWFVGLSPYAVCSVWTGFDDPHTVIKPDRAICIESFQKAMSFYLKDKEQKDYSLAKTVIEKNYCTSTGLLATSSCTKTEKGYYNPENVPGYCYGHYTPAPTTVPPDDDLTEPPDDVTEPPDDGQQTTQTVTEATDKPTDAPE